MSKGVVLKTQKSSVEIYFPFVFFVIAVHAGLAIWVLNNSLGAVNSHNEETIVISLRSGEHRSQAKTQLTTNPLQSHHHIAAVPSSNTGKSDMQEDAANGSPLKHGDHGLAGRSLFFNPKPHYPLASRRMGEQGAVHLQLCVGSRGFVESVRLTQSSGYQNLDRSAIEAVKAWRFSALSEASDNGSKCYQLPIHFQLES